jgi:hypothetical protein
METQMFDPAGEGFRVQFRIVAFMALGLPWSGDP